MARRRGNNNPRRFFEKLAVRVTPEMYEWVGRQAQLQDLPMTDFLRQLIAEKMEVER